MKKIFTVLVAGLMMSAQMMAVSTKDVCGQFDGELWLDWDSYGSKSVYLLPGATSNTLTFVLPDFMFGAGKLGNIVLPNITMDENGTLTLEETSLYLDSIKLRASITMLNNYEYESKTYNSVVSATKAQVTLQISEPNTLPMPIIVVFDGKAVRDNNYALPNGGFEGAWTNNEPQGWHSFGTATGDFANFVKGNTMQFVQSNQVRPGSEGTQSALLSSKVVFFIPANGNCTNGQINAGSMTADDASGNYNFSDPTNAGFNTPFNGRPDSIVFWAKYVPADKNPSNEVNKARLNTVITTDARYQDPEGEKDYSAVKLGQATINYAATSNMGWQRLSVPFEYTDNAGKPAYILTTFSTNATPGGGSSASQKLDSVYIDDVELVYNKNLRYFVIDGQLNAFYNRIVSLEGTYCDDCAKYNTVAIGKSVQTFIGFDAIHKCIQVYVIADDFAQTGDYRLYRVEFEDSVTDDLDPLNQAIETVKGANNRFEKVLIDGQLIIRCGEVWYNINGARIR